jgi:hypothetical protein
VPVRREEQEFPTRGMRYREASRTEAADTESIAPIGGNKRSLLQPGQLYRFVMGKDPAPVPMPEADLEHVLHDPFAELILKRRVFPLTLRATLEEINKRNSDPQGMPTQKAFLVADGGQIPWAPQTSEVHREFRFAVARFRGADATLLISASSVLDSETNFLQVIGWDPVNAVYNYYDRDRTSGAWIWAGNSRDALAPETRGHGPFDSHVNGSLVMKELRAPWNNWHSMSASITEVALAPDDPLRHEPLFLNRESAHLLETSVVRPGIRRWNQARLDRAISTANASFSEVRLFLRQILETTTVNLTTSDQQSAMLNDNDTLRLPTTFFLNTDSFLDTIGLEPQVGVIEVPARFYRNSLGRYEFALTDGSYRRPGDTFFAFLCPEPAFEDLDVLALLVQRGLISRRFAACLMMVDFPNPILSKRRQSLMRYVPEVARMVAGTAGGPQSDLEERFAAAVAAATMVTDSAEEEFLQNWRLPETAWQSAMERRIEGYFAELQRQAADEEGFDGWVRLAECRRREFRSRPLAEFRLTAPVTNIPDSAPILEMHEDGTVHRVQP